MFKISLLFIGAFLFTQTLFASPVDINTANADEIAKSLKGIGPGKAAAIVAFRTENGPFEIAEDLVKVKGIGEKTLEKNMDDILIVSGNNQ